MNLIKLIKLQLNPAYSLSAIRWYARHDKKKVAGFLGLGLIILFSLAPMYWFLYINGVREIYNTGAMFGQPQLVLILVLAFVSLVVLVFGHADRLQNLAGSLAAAIGLPEHKIADIRLFAQFHDIGKVGIPDRILFKEAPLNEEERLEMNRHCEIGHRIALSAPDLVPLADWILKHHEWWDGQGYPFGLKGKDIPLECRILALADAYDAMTSNRPYRSALTHTAAILELQKYAGTQFDPTLVEQFIDVLETIHSNPDTQHNIA
jgi:response regulator RpfG family c-di-GMP phosphodiesterase